MEERDEDWTLLRSYVYGTGIDEPLVLVSNPESQSYFYCFDSLGSVTEIADYEGNVVEHYRYSPFGAVRIYNSSWTEMSESSVGNTYCFTGRNFDQETGLYFYRARMYSAGLGRFCQVDPIGYHSCLNMYQYCSNSPIDNVDRYGLDALGIIVETLLESYDQGKRQIDAMYSNSMYSQYGRSFPHTALYAVAGQYLIDQIQNNPLKDVTGIACRYTSGGQGVEV